MTMPALRRPAIWRPQTGILSASRVLRGFGEWRALAFHQRLLYTLSEPLGTGLRMSGNLLNGTTPIRAGCQLHALTH